MNKPVKYKNIIAEPKELIQIVRGETMPRGKPELGGEWDLPITEGDKSYTLHLKLYKSTLKILDGAGNSINLDKRDDKIRIQRWEMLNGKRKRQITSEDKS